MSSHRRAIPVAVSVLSLAVAVIFFLASNEATATSACKSFNGKVELQQIVGPECVSPVGVCANVILSGGLKGQGVYTVSTLTQTVDTPTTAVVLLSGDTRLQTGDGDLTLKLATVLRTTGAGEYSELETVVGGTEGWQGKTGTIQVIGTFSNGIGSGEYSGSICTP